ncbi:hypothetical protein [Cyclobacterium marinum]|uniref:Uncharacterized protein n=1 Tax=Cyclobacterium marinum (strain ATCC 25205 / DSM 745 / LMG 13164 / NCIMB 1802) TaxID=880070 RepID=G0J378_CYCMS|nr:hypothetical protein [Cyclobacterium marinum]AEL24019.1 hypothetical protein Cycma_0237 [Cyclobacterium marinum DSM 745]
MAKNTENNNVLQNRWPEKKKDQLGLRTDVEKIVLYHQGKLPNAELSPALEEKINRMKECSNLIQKYGGAKKVISMMEGLWGISYSTAKRIYNETQEAFGDLTNFNKQFHIDTYMQFLITGINLAKESGDGKTFTGLMKEYKNAIKEFMGTSEADIYKQIQVPTFEVGFFPEELNTKLPANWKTRVKKLVEEKKRLDEIEDAIVLEPTDGDGED